MEMVRLKRLIRHAERRLRRQRAMVGRLRRQGEDAAQPLRLLQRRWSGARG